MDSYQLARTMHQPLGRFRATEQLASEGSLARFFLRHETGELFPFFWSKNVTKKIYVGNLPWSISDDRLAEVFAEYGDVVSARVVTDRETGRSRGFGFVEMENADADEAIRALDGNDVDGRTLKVNEAKPREPRPQRNRW